MERKEGDLNLRFCATFVVTLRDSDFDAKEVFLTGDGHFCDILWSRDTSRTSARA